MAYYEHQLVSLNHVKRKNKQQSNINNKIITRNHTEYTTEYGKHITHWTKSSTSSDTTQCDTLYPKIHINEKKTYEKRSLIKINFIQ